MAALGPWVTVGDRTKTSGVSRDGKDREAWPARQLGSGPGVGELVLSWPFCEVRQTSSPCKMGHQECPLQASCADAVAQARLPGQRLILSHLLPFVPGTCGVPGSSTQSSMEGSTCHMPRAFPLAKKPQSQTNLGSGHPSTFSALLVGDGQVDVSPTQGLQLC